MYLFIHCNLYVLILYSCTYIYDIYIRMICIAYFFCLSILIWFVWLFCYCCVLICWLLDCLCLTYLCCYLSIYLCHVHSCIYLFVHLFTVCMCVFCFFVNLIIYRLIYSMIGWLNLGSIDQCMVYLLVYKDLRFNLSLYICHFFRAIWPLIYARLHSSIHGLIHGLIQCIMIPRVHLFLPSLSCLFIDPTIHVLVWF